MCLYVVTSHSLANSLRAKLYRDYTYRAPSKSFLRSLIFQGIPTHPDYRDPYTRCWTDGDLLLCRHEQSIQALCITTILIRIHFLCCAYRVSLNRVLSHDGLQAFDPHAQGMMFFFQGSNHSPYYVKMFFVFSYHPCFSTSLLYHIVHTMSTCFL